MWKMSHLKAMKAKLLEKLIGMKFNVEYLKSTALQMHDYVTHGKSSFESLIDLLENKVCQFCVGVWVLTFFFKIGIWNFGARMFCLDQIQLVYMFT